MIEQHAPSEDQLVMDAIHGRFDARDDSESDFQTEMVLRMAAFSNEFGSHPASDSDWRIRAF